MSKALNPHLHQGPETRLVVLGSLQLENVNFSGRTFRSSTVVPFAAGRRIFQDLREAVRGFLCVFVCNWKSLSCIRKHLTG